MVMFNGCAVNVVDLARRFQLPLSRPGKQPKVVVAETARGMIGFVADRVSVRWLYPGVLFAWSLMGFLAAWTTDFSQLLVCRTLLGLFEAGHWPCALKTTHLLLSAQDRTMGNSVLQSGASIGAIITPLVMRAMMTNAAGSWRLPFQFVGAVGILWVVAWFASIQIGRAHV